MIGNFFNTVEVDQYADWIVGELKRSLPPDFNQDIKKFAERLQKMNERIEYRTKEFTQKTRLNIYKKAHLAARVREGLSAQGYKEAFVKEFSYELIARIQAASSKLTR